MSSVRKLTITADEAGQRLDRWLRRHFPHVPQGRIEKLCRKGEIRIDGGRVKAATRVEQGQAVRIPPLPEADAQPGSNAGAAISPVDAAAIRAAVLYRDDQLIAIDKPPGLPTQGGSKQNRHVDGLADALRFGFDEKPRLVHRLDKDTSGVLLLARTRAAAEALARAFRARETRKIYWAAIAGVPSPKMGTVRFGLVKAPADSGRGKMLCVHPGQVASVPGAKPAATDYAVLSRLANRAAWVALAPITGRTHQLRAHMAELGHPVIGDRKYGRSGQDNPGDGWGAQLGGEISRKLHLHARGLMLVHPFTGASLSLAAPLPPHMERTWAALGWKASDAPTDPFGQAAETRA